MNRIRCMLFAAIVVFSSSTLALGGIIQTPGKSDPPPPQPLSVSATESNTDGVNAPSTETIQIAGQDPATTMLIEILLTIY